jgi:putative membrane protein
LVPGVSGGTIALIFGIYDEFIFSLSKLSFSSLLLIKNKGFKAFWIEINGLFLSKLFSGIIIGVSLFTFLIDWLIKDYPILLWAFFNGILLSSTIIIYKKIKKPTIKLLLFFFFGLIISFCIVQLNPDSELNSSNKFYLFISSLIASSAMILPGISGAYMLILFGTYSEVISTIKSMLNIIILQDLTNLDIIVYKFLIIVLGIISGILIFSKVFKFLLSKYYDKTLVFMVGLMLGSISKIWPWKEGVENVLPIKFSGENQIQASFIFFILGILFIFIIQFLEKQK